MREIRAVKACPGCRRLLQVIVNVTFNRKRGAVDGLQPYCRECDARFKNGHKNGLVNFKRELKRRGLDEWTRHRWTEATYHDILAGKNWECHYCGWDVKEWGATGYWLDKIDPDREYEPSNVVPCCWVCNRRKSNSHPSVYTIEIKPHLAEWGRGRIPWQRYLPQATRATFPDLRAYVIRNPQLGLFGGNGDGEDAA